MIVVACAVWVYIDARVIGVHKGLIPGFFNLGAGSWCVVTLLLWIIGFPAYVIKRGELKAAAAAEQAAKLGGAGAGSASTESEKLANLEKLASLRDRGVLTPAEFEQKKKELLS